MPEHAAKRKQTFNLSTSLIAAAVKTVYIYIIVVRLCVSSCTCSYTSILGITLRFRSDSRENCSSRKNNWQPRLSFPSSWPPPYQSINQFGRATERDFVVVVVDGGGSHTTATENRRTENTAVGRILHSSYLFTVRLTLYVL